MDLVGRKLPMKSGAVVKDLLTVMAAVDTRLAHHAEEFAVLRTAFGDALTHLVEATLWITKHGAENPQDAMAGSVAYLRLFATTVGGWLLARQALAAREVLDAGADDPGFYEAKIATAVFYAEQILPLTGALSRIAQAGSDTVMAFDPDRL
jgi:hypothetical protein